MKSPFHPYESYLIPKARKLRKDSTFPERLLWSHLRRHQLGFRFLRQHPIGSYVVDFYCPEAELVVEIDGRSHDGRFEYDTERQLALERSGLRVLRFSNDDVLQDLNRIVTQLHAWLEDHASWDAARQGRRV